MRRGKLKPDTRLDWRDSDMPVIRKVTMSDGKTAVVKIPPKKIEEYYSNKILGRNYDEPNWRNDPSYDWRKK